MGVEYTGSAPITPTQSTSTGSVQYTGSAPIQQDSSSKKDTSTGYTPVYNPSLDLHVSVPNAVQNGTVQSSSGFNFWDSIVSTGKKILDFFNTPVDPKTQALKDRAEKESDDWRKAGGSDPNYTNAMGATNKVTAAQKVKDLEVSKSSGTLKLDPFNTLLTANKILAPYGTLGGTSQETIAYTQTSEDLKQLGYQYILNKETGQQELLPVSQPSISPDQIASKRTSLNLQFSNKIAELNNVLDKNKSIKAPPTKNVGLDEPTPEGPPSMTFGERKEVTDQILALQKAKEDANALYAAVQIKQLEQGNNPNFQVSSTYLQDHANDKTLNLNDYAQKLSEALPVIKGLTQKDPKAVRDDLVTKGMYLEFGGDMPSLNTARAILQSGNSDNKIPKWKVDQWALAGATMDARSVAESLAADKKIKTQIDTKYRKNVVDQIVKQNPTASQEQIDQILDKIGINSASKALGESIQAKQSVVDNIKVTTKGGLNYLVNYENAQKTLDELYSKFPIVNLAYIPAKALNDLTHLPSNALNMLKGLADTHIASDFEKHLPEEVASVPRYEETLPDGTKAMLPITQKPINIFGKDTNLNNPKNWNWDVFGGQAAKLVIELLALKGAGRLAATGAEALYGEGLETLRLGSELQKASPLLDSQLEGLPMSYQTAYNLAKVGDKILVGTLGQATPAMLLWGPDNIKAEMDKKNITVAQATKLGLLRSAVEGLIYSESPTALMQASERLAKGEIESAFEHEAYAQLVKNNWASWTGKSITDKTLRFLMDNGSAGLEGYLNSATDLVIQQNSALIANHAISELVRMSNPAYSDPEHDLTRQNFLNATVTALGTAIPFGMLHAKGIKDQTEYARTSALFHMANAPEWYKYHIKDRLDNGEISEDEALRQQHIIDQAAAINIGLRPKFAEISEDLTLTDTEKHKQKLDLFTNRTRQVGILNEITNLADQTVDETSGKVTTERERLLQKLTDVNKEYQEMLDLKKARENMTPDERNLHDFNNFWKDNGHLFQDLDKLTLLELDRRRSVLHDLLQKETNPYISSTMYSTMRDIEIRMSDKGYRKHNNEFRDQQLQDLIPKVQDLAQRGHEEYDGHVRKGTHDEEGRRDFVKQFVEDNLSPWEMKNYRDLERISKENQRPQEEPTPTSAQEEVTHDIPSIDMTPPTEKPKKERYFNQHAEYTDPKNEILQGFGLPQDVQIGSKIVNKNIQGKVSSDGEVYTFKPNNTVNGEFVSSAGIRLSVQDFKDQFFPLMSDKQKELFEDATKDAENLEFKEARLGLTGTYKGQLNLDYYVDGAFEVGTTILPNQYLINQADAILAENLPKEVINQLQAKRTEDYVALSENDKDIQETNNSGQMALHKMQGVTAMPDEENDTNKKLVEGWNALAYAAVDAFFNGSNWEKTSDVLNPLYQAFHSKKFFTPGTTFTLTSNTKAGSPYFNKAVEQFIENGQGADGLIASGIVTQEEFNNILAMVAAFTQKDADFGNNVIAPLHTIDYMRPDRVVETTYTASGDPIPNLSQNFHKALALLTALHKAFEAGKTVTGEIESVGPGSLSIRSDKKYVPLKSAFKNPEILNPRHLSVTRNPQKDVMFKGVPVANGNALNVGSVVVAVPTPASDVNKSTFGVTLRRKALGQEGSTAAVNLLRFYTDYRGKRLKGEDLSKMDGIVEDFSKDTHNPDEFDITSLEGVKKIMNEMVHASQKISDYLNSETREDMKDVPVLDFSLEQGGTITFSNKREFTNIGPEERISGSDLKKLASIGVYKQFLFIKDEKGNLVPNPNNEFFFKKFERFLLDKRMNFKAANMGIDEPYKMPYLAKDGDNWAVTDPKTITNSGKTYWDYMVNNLETNVLEHQITNPDGSKEFAYMEQPTINLKFHGLDEQPEVDPLQDVYDYVDKLKKTESYTEAKALVDSEGHKFPGIAETTKYELNKKKALMTHEEKEKEFNEVNGPHNDLVNKVKTFNSLSSAQKGNAKGRALLMRIEQAIPKDYTLTKPRGTKQNITVRDSKGNTIRIKSLPAKLLPVTEGQIEFRGEKVGLPEGVAFKYNWNLTDQGVVKEDWGLSNVELLSGFKAIEKGNLEHLNAQRILKAIAVWKSEGFVSFKQGGHVVYETVPYQDYIDNYLNKIKDFNEETLSDDDKQGYINEFDAWWDSLSDDAKQEELDNYEEARRNSEDYIASNFERENTGDVQEEIDDTAAKQEFSEYIKNLKKSSEIKYSLSAIKILSSDKAEKIWNKGIKNRWDLNKILSELQIPKDQKQIILDWAKDNKPESISDIVTGILADLSYSVEINTAKSNKSTGYEFDEDGHYIDNSGDILDNEENTQHYLKLTALGHTKENGWEYEEREIAIPGIIPSIKGHAQFSTDNGIGWSRVTINKAKGILAVNENQSDLFQKGRDKEDLDGKSFKSKLNNEEKKDHSDLLNRLENLSPEEFDRFSDLNTRAIDTNTKENQFLQLLNKDGNWIPFFIKAQVQDAIKQEMKEIWFPTGDTASKIEGHNTLEEFKKEKEARIQDLQRDNKELELPVSTISYYESKGSSKFTDNPEVAKHLNYTYKVNKSKNRIEQDVESNKYGIENNNKEIKQLQEELKRVETEGFGALKPIWEFYETRVKNILDKTYGKENIERITDDYGSQWFKLQLEDKFALPISLPSSGNDYSEFGNTTESKGSISDRPNFNKNYTDVSTVYSELPLNIKNNVGSLQDILEDKKDWSEKMIIDWLKCK